jgi:hypothetical protein
MNIIGGLMLELTKIQEGRRSLFLGEVISADEPVNTKYTDQKESSEAILKVTLEDTELDFVELQDKKLEDII